MDLSHGARNQGGVEPEGAEGRYDETFCEGVLHRFPAVSGGAGDLCGAGGRIRVDVADFSTIAALFRKAAKLLAAPRRSLLELSYAEFSRHLSLLCIYACIGLCS